MCSTKHSPQGALQSQWVHVSDAFNHQGPTFQKPEIAERPNIPHLSQQTTTNYNHNNCVNSCWKNDIFSAISIFHLYLVTLGVENDGWFSCLAQTLKFHPQGMCTLIILGGLKCRNDNPRIILVKSMMHPHWIKSVDTFLLHVHTKTKWIKIMASL